MSWITNDERASTEGMTGFMMKIFAVFVALACLAVAISVAGKSVGRSIALAGHTTDATVHDLVIGNEVLSLPANMIRFDSARRSGDVARVDLYLKWPGLTGYTDATSDAFNHLDAADPVVFVTFEPRSLAIDMSARLDPVYRMLIAQEGRSVEAGLEEFRFLDESSYRNEILVVEPAREIRPFVARCLESEAVDDILAPCERDVHVGENLAMRYRFPRTLLADWEALDRAMTEFADSVIATGENGNAARL